MALVALVVLVALSGWRASSDWCAESHRFNFCWGLDIFSLLHARDIKTLHLSHFITELNIITFTIFLFSHLSLCLLFTTYFRIQANRPDKILY